MGKDKKVEEALKKLEQGIEKIAEVFDQYTETVRQEMAFVNQKITDLESRIDNIETWFSFSEGGEAVRRTPSGIGATQRPSATFSKAPVEEAYTPPAESYSAQPREAEAEVGYRPSTPTRQPTRRAPEPTSFVTVDELRGEEPSQEPGFGGYRPMRGGIVEEKFVKPSVFSKEMNKLHDAHAAAAAQTPYGPGGYTPPPSMQLRQEVSRVLGKIRPEAQRRVPRPSPVQEYGTEPGYQAPSRPTYGEEYGAPQPPSPAYEAEPPPAPAGEDKTVSVPDNWLPESSRAKYYDPKKIKKGKIKDLEKKTKDIFK